MVGADPGFVDAVGLVATARRLRWARPDLTAALAEHAAEISPDDDASWLRAVGWLVHARACTGDGREAATAAISDLLLRCPALVTDSAAGRLRVEIAGLAAGCGATGLAGRLIEPALTAADAELRADAAIVLLRCTIHDGSTAVVESLGRAEAAWRDVDGPRGEIGAALVCLLAAAALRRSGQAGAAVERAAEGLARLDAVRGERTVTPSRHLAAGLAAEWIGALVEAGRADDAREGCAPLRPRLRETARPSRQTALLRLTVARALAGTDRQDVVSGLERAAADAASSDAPDLEAVCLTALAAVHEDEARTAQTERAAAAQARDTARRATFLTALHELAAVCDPPAPQPPVTSDAAVGAGGSARTEPSVAEAVEAADGPLPATTGAAAVDPEPVDDEEPHPLAVASGWARWTAGRATSTERSGRADRPGGRRRRVDEPAEDGRSGSRRAAAGEEPHAAEQPARSGSGTVEDGGPLDVGDAGFAGDGWMHGALTELEQDWERPVGAVPAPAPVMGGSTVVLELLAGAGPVGGTDADTVFALLGGRLDGVLPEGGRVRRDPDALTVVLPGHDRAAATAWMHAELPGPLAEMVSREHPPGTSLRAAVHDADGPVGAQLLQRVDTVSPQAAEDAPRAEHDPVAAGGSAGRHGTDRPGAVRSWFELSAVPVGSGGRRHRPDPADSAAAGAAPHAHASPGARPAAAGPPDAGQAQRPTPQGAGAGAVTDSPDPSGVSEVAERPHMPAVLDSAGISGTGTDPVVAQAAEPADAKVPAATEGGRGGSAAGSRREGTPDPPPAEHDAPRSGTVEPLSTDGLGLADLLAGALAAYRSI